MSYFYSGATLKNGSQGQDVTEWQKFLASQGYYSGSIDGIFGSKTDAATRAYQKANGLTEDGIAGINTFTKAGFKNYNQAVDAPTIAPAPTAPTFNLTAWDDTNEGKAASKAKTDAETAYNSYGNPNWDKQQTYEDQLQEYLDRPDFSYDFNADALYQQYKDKYIQQGKMAMADVMGQASAMTGGYGNSYAATAGSQAYQAHLQNLNDIIPELYQLAMDKYNLKGQEMLNRLGLLDKDYEKYMNEWGIGYDKVKDALNYANGEYYNGATLYGNEVDRANSAAQQGYTNEFNAWTAENENAWNQAEWDESARRYALSLLAGSGDGVGGGSSGGSGGSSSGGGKKPQTSNDDNTDVETKDTYADWDYGDWEGYFATIRNTESKAAAEEELNRMNRAGLIPKNMIVAASIGARGSLGH